MNNKIIEFPAKEAGANKTIASEVELAQAVGNENISTYSYQGVEKDNDKIIPFPGKKRPQFTYIETCAGLGATSLALKEVGEKLGFDFTCVAYSEIDKVAIRAYKELHGPTLVNLGDVTKVDWSKYPCDLLSFTFPCQNISIANRKGKGFEEGEDSSSSIVWSLRDVLSKMKQKPKVIFMENVAAILNKKHKPTLDKLITFLQSEGYHVDYKKLDAADYGVPQHRERVYILCTLGFDPCFTYPAPIPLETKLCDVLEKNPSPQFNLTPKAKAGFISRGMRDDKPYPIRVHNPSKCDKAFTISCRSGSRNYDNFILGEDLNQDKFFKVSQKGLAKAGVDIKDIENANIRKLTPNECMLLMGLKKEEREKLKDFTPSEIYKLTGNSIVVPVLEQVFYEYFKALKDSGKLDDMDMAS